MLLCGDAKGKERDIRSFNGLWQPQTPSALSLSLSCSTFPALHSLLPLFFLCFSDRNPYRPASVSVKVSTVKPLSTLSAPCVCQWGFLIGFFSHFRAAQSHFISLAEKNRPQNFTLRVGPFLAPKSQIKPSHGFLSDTRLYWNVSQKSYNLSFCLSIHLSIHLFTHPMRFTHNTHSHSDTLRSSSGLQKLDKIHSPLEDILSSTIHICVQSTALQNKNVPPPNTTSCILYNDWCTITYGYLLLLKKKTKSLKLPVANGNIRMSFYNACFCNRYNIVPSKYTIFT